MLALRRSGDSLSAKGGFRSALSLVERAGCVEHGALPIALRRQGDELFARDGAELQRGDEGSVGAARQQRDALFSKPVPGAAVAAQTLHIIVLLSHSLNLEARDRLALQLLEQQGEARAGAAGREDIYPVGFREDLPEVWRVGLAAE